MKNLLFIITLFLSLSVFSQNMNTEKLNKIIIQEADSIKRNGNSWNFSFKNKLLICIADTKANRMRIISPVISQQNLTREQILNSLIANFHTALDVKYALSNEVLWSVFTHPLKELTEHQVKDAILQVYNANITFGSIYSSTSLTFPATERKQKKEIKTPVLKKI